MLCAFRSLFGSIYMVKCDMALVVIIMPKKRTIGYCQFNMARKGLSVKDTTDFKKVLDYIEKADTSGRNYDFVKPEKSAGVESIERRKDGHIWIVFKTGRYNHTAPLINREDGSEREHDKTMDEGEKELTHMCLRIYPEFVVCSIESNRYGIGASLITAYFNHFLEVIGSDQHISLSYLSMKGISDILNNAQRISSVELECSYMKSDDELFRGVFGEGIKETFIVNLSPERARSFDKSKIVKIYNSVEPHGKVSRMKIAIKSDEGNDMVLDTFMDKVRDEEYCNIDQNGVVISSEIFPILQDHLLNFEV